MNSEQEMLALLENSAQQFINHQIEQQNDEGKRWLSMAELGWLGVTLPESLGGLGLGISEISALTRLFGQAALTTRFCGDCVLPSVILAAAEHSPVVADLAEPFIMGSAKIALAWQETTGHIATSQLNTRLEAGQLTGSKLFVAGADLAQHFLVSCLYNNQPAIVLISAEQSGITRSIAENSSGGFGAVQFEGVSVDSDHILLSGDAAEKALTRSIEYAQIALAAELEGLARGCLDKTVEYLQTRRQFNQSLGSFQAIRHRCADLLIQCRLAESSWRRAVRDYQPDADNQQIHAAKARCADAAFKTAKEGVQMHGAMGFTEEAGVGNYLRSAIGLSSWLGSAQQHRQLLLQATQPELCNHV